MAESLVEKYKKMIMESSDTSQGVQNTFQQPEMNSLEGYKTYSSGTGGSLVGITNLNPDLTPIKPQAPQAQPSRLEQIYNASRQEQLPQSEYDGTFATMATDLLNKAANAPAGTTVAKVKSLIDAAHQFASMDAAAKQESASMYSSNMGYKTANAPVKWADIFSTDSYRQRESISNDFAKKAQALESLSRVDAQPSISAAHLAEAATKLDALANNLSAEDKIYFDRLSQRENETNKIAMAMIAKGDAEERPWHFFGDKKLTDDYKMIQRQQAENESAVNKFLNRIRTKKGQPTIAPTEDDAKKKEIDNFFKQFGR